MEKNKMLVDATHPEETRVVVLRGGRVEEFDYESAARKPLRGNIYLAKVTRVEPSLQAAFVEYGGNRHGFLAFSEIHPDYYQIPFADRQALLDEEAEEEARAEQEADARAERRARRDRHGRRSRGSRREDAGAGERTATGEGHEHDHPGDDHGDADHDRHVADHGDGEHHHEDRVAHGEGEDAPRAMAAEHTHDDDRQVSEVPDHHGHEHEHGHEYEAAATAPSDEDGDDEVGDAPAPIGLVEDVGVSEVDDGGNGENGDGGNGESIEQVGAEDALEELPERPRRRARQYKIQEVIKRRQIILVQVVKEERGNKGAALTTYLSLAGRYTVLMPNTGRGGGISRKITNPQDRKRLKAIAQDLEVPEGMGLIIRTAGAARTKQEIKRDFEYLLRLWESVREMTLRSTAPYLVYEEGNLIKRSLRDLYSKDIDEVLVAGRGAYEEAHDFMRMLMPSHAQNVVNYDHPDPLFTRFQIERQLNAMFSPYVTLRSGGYLVINQTEALVSIDVNSGKATREFSIEETALNTNLEASDEIARQLKLRDLAGLIVIDFIDMEEKRNNRAVERRLKDALRFDRARIQVGHISHFGLLEMSRQRLRTGVLEGSTSQCPHCQGTGIIRSTESVALAVLRAIEDHLMKGPPSSLSAITTTSVALYILNQKRGFITEIERRYGITVAVTSSDRMQGATFAIERTAEPVSAPRHAERGAVSMDWGFEGSDEEGEDDAEAAEAREEASEESGRDGSRSRRRRRGRGRRGERRPRDAEPMTARDDGEPVDAEDEEHGHEPSHAHHEHDEPHRGAESGADLADTEAQGSGEGASEDEGASEERRGRRRRRGRRGGRSRGRERETGEAAGAAPGDDQPDVAPDYMPHGEWGTYTPVDRHLPETEGDQPHVGSEEAGHARAASGSSEPAETAHEPHDPAPRHAAPERSEPQHHEAHHEPAVTPVANDVPAVPMAAVAPADPVREPEPAPTVEEVASADERTPEPAHAAPAGPEPLEDTEPTGPPRKGWWQRRFGGG